MRRLIVLSVVLFVAMGLAAQQYDLVIDRVLEDVAGNRVGRPFEVDEDTRPIDAEGPPVRRAFEIR